MKTSGENRLVSEKVAQPLIIFKLIEKCNKFNKPLCIGQ